MNAAIGIGLLAATAILFAWAYGQYRRPAPAPWTRIESLSIAVVLAIVSMICFGLAFLGSFALDLSAETGWTADLVTAGVALVLCWLLVPRLMAPARQAPQPSPAHSAGAANLGSPSGPGTPSNRNVPGGGRSRRRRAA
ncbi:hypothetical protein [Oceanibacterium hippocampi]|uniref:Uncharacterized protein n=1 Tax=Oceanibacterium hippocampi TaxID=745714 RepID=A0A1Y5SE51_9PROT|nr:hypothetical protein [Oceanibacterium hippocampi]SLN38625.1 hypothetical protein OCH7691_01598 [Oceanibacterium hippocampi]